MLATGAVAAVLALLGRCLGGALAGPGDSALYRLVLYSLSGWLGLHLLLTALGLAAIPWRLPILLAAAGAFAVLGWRYLPAPAGRTRLPSDYGWGDGLALAALLVFTAFALSLWITIPDFVYHWGLKGHRFYLAQGVDYPYLARSWNWVLHPDYPNLLPELFATTAVVVGRFDQAAMMVWSAICFALLLAAVRETLRRAGASRFLTQAALATLALVLAAYGIGGESAGGADWLIALALAAALPPLLAPADWRGAAQIGVIAAYAAAAKVEGVPLAASLVGIYAARLWIRRRRRPTSPSADLRVAAALVLPAVAVVLPWLAAVRRYQLFQAFNSGPFVPGRAPQVFAAVAGMLEAKSWHGFSYGLALLPLLALDRRLRALAAVVGLQLLFYFYVYFSVRIDPVALIAASFPRLVLHLLPAVLTGAAVALEPAGRAEPTAHRSAASGA